MFSLAPSNEQNRMLTPRSPWPPQLKLGVIITSRICCVLLLYTVIFIGFSTLAFSKSFRTSLSWFYKKTGHSIISSMRINWDVAESTTYIRITQMWFTACIGVQWYLANGLTRRVFPIATIKSKNASSPAAEPGDLSWTWNTIQKYIASPFSKENLWRMLFVKISLSMVQPSGACVSVTSKYNLLRDMRINTFEFALKLPLYFQPVTRSEDETSNYWISL